MFVHKAEKMPEIKIPEEDKLVVLNKKFAIIFISEY